MCVFVSVCFEWAAYQSWSKEHSQQSQAGTHHYEEQKDNQRMLLAHTVVWFIQPVWGLVSLHFTTTSSSVYFRLPCPVKEIPLSPYSLLPHGSWSWEGGKRGGGQCWGMSSFHHRWGAVALFCSSAVVVPVEDPEVRAPKLQLSLRVLLHLPSQVFQAGTAESWGWVWVRGSVRWPEWWQKRTKGRAQHPPLSPPANMLGWKMKRSAGSECSLEWEREKWEGSGGKEEGERAKGEGRKKKKVQQQGKVSKWMKE